MKGREDLCVRQTKSLLLHVQVAPDGLDDPLGGLDSSTGSFRIDCRKSRIASVYGIRRERFNVELRESGFDSLRKEAHQSFEIVRIGKRALVKNEKRLQCLLRCLLGKPGRLARNAHGFCKQLLTGPKILARMSEPQSRVRSRIWITHASLCSLE